MCVCIVAKCGRDSWVYVPAVSRLTQKAANVQEFLQTLTLEEQVFVPRRIYKPFRSEESSTTNLKSGRGSRKGRGYKISQSRN